MMDTLVSLDCSCQHVAVPPEIQEIKPHIDDDMYTMHQINTAKAVPCFLNQTPQAFLATLVTHAESQDKYSTPVFTESENHSFTAVMVGDNTRQLVD